MARECPAGYVNESGIINPAIGEGDPAEVEKRWRQWQQRLCAWADTFRKEREAKQGLGRNRSSPPRRR